MEFVCGRTIEVGLCGLMGRGVRFVPPDGHSGGAQYSHKTASTSMYVRDQELPELPRKRGKIALYDRTALCKSLVFKPRRERNGRPKILISSHQQVVFHDLIKIIRS